MRRAVPRRGCSAACSRPSPCRAIPTRSMAASRLSMGWTDIPYPIPHLRVENGPAKAHVRIGWLRSVRTYLSCLRRADIHRRTGARRGRARSRRIPARAARRSRASSTSARKACSKCGPPNPKFPFDTARLRNVIEIAAEKSGWANKQAGAGPRVGHRRASQLFHLRGRGRGGGSDTEGRDPHSARGYRGGRRTRHQSRPREVAVRRRGGVRRQSSR